MKRALFPALAGVSLTLCALTFGSRPLFVPGVGFTLLAALAPAWVWLAGRGTQVSRRLSCDRALEGEPVEAIITVRRGILGLAGGELLEPLAGGVVRLHRGGGRPPGAADSEVRVVARFPRRGLQRLAPPELVLRDPFALTRSRRPAAAGPLELLILPRVEPLRWLPAARHAERVGGRVGAGGEEAAAAVDIDGLRPYREGAPASRIHWSALARGQGLMERRLRPHSDARPLVVLDVRGGGPAEHLDQAVRAAASLVRGLARQGGCRILLPGERRPVTVGEDLTGWPAVHARLATVAGDADSPAPLLAPRAMADTLVWVTAGAGRSPAAGGRPPGLLVLPAAVPAPGAATPVLEVCGCRGYML